MWHIIIIVKPLGGTKSLLIYLCIYFLSSSSPLSSLIPISNDCVRCYISARSHPGASLCLQTTALSGTNAPFLCTDCWFTMPRTGSSQLLPRPHRKTRTVLKVLQGPVSSRLDFHEDQLALNPLRKKCLNLIESSFYLYINPCHFVVTLVSSLLHSSVIFYLLKRELDISIIW